MRPDCRGREAQLLNAYISCIYKFLGLFLPGVGVGVSLNEALNVPRVSA